MTWNCVIDFSALRTLHLDRDLDFSSLRWLVSNAPFDLLRNLSMTFALYSRLYRDGEEEEYLRLFNSLISSLPPLESVTLAVNPFTSDHFTSVMQYHGKTLRKLHLNTIGDLTSVVFDAPTVTLLGQHCPLLEELKLLVPRSKGDQKEVAIYHALGAMPRLQDVVLMLDCSNRGDIWRSLPEDTDGYYEISNDPSFDAFHQSFVPPDEYDPGPTPRNGHVRDTLINCALDENLARSIFQCISAVKGPSSFSLESLQLGMYGAGFFGEPDEPGTRLPVAGLADVLDRIGRSWKVERNMRDDRRDQLIIEQLPESTLCDPSALLSHMAYGDHDPDALTPQIEPVLRRLWPGNEDGSSSWLGDWHSFPLSDV